MIKEITDYLREKVKSFNWDYDLALSWVEWNWKYGFIGVVKDEDKIVGVGIARPIKEIELSKDHYYFDETGEILFVDMVAANERFYVNVLLSQAIRRFGEKPYYAFKKSKYSNKIRANLTERLIRRLDSCLN